MDLYILHTHIHNYVCVRLHAIIGRGRVFYFSNECKSSVGVAVPHLQTALKSGGQDVSVERDKT